ncbi:hypothetical protein BS50DRAFT_592294 [Corynespora cassiicola Philippines]|uniref:Uncharacterized protein n=1 Tax=Corynespora cassiicola Philippines TaxID=1448308 RepID=A0A2T2N9B2_CORCC|nr:hypothetical protein BS50DRAFT_592294 [Corynespora cassiicola Philippines]
MERLGLESKSTGGHRQLMVTLTKWLSDGSKVKHGSVIFTCRRKDVAFSVVKNRKKAIGVEELSRENCLEILHDHLGNLCDEESAEGLVKNLGGVPSILLQAANKIHEFGSAKRYLAFYTANDDNRGRLLRQRRGISQYLSSSPIPWEEDFQALFEEDFHAIALLKSLMYLNSDSISKPLVRELKSGVESTKWPLEEDLEFAQHVALLENYFFVRSRVEQDDFFLHRAVQTCFRIWVTDTSVHEFTHGQTVRMLHSKFREAEFCEWPICRILLPHIEMVAIRRPQLRENLQDWCSLLINGA